MVKVSETNGRLKRTTQSKRTSEGEGDSRIGTHSTQSKRTSKGVGEGLVGRIMDFVGTYIVLTDVDLLVVAAWVMASWSHDKFDRFPHLAVTSPDRRCGKTRLLQIIELLTRNAYNTTNISPAAVYRLIEKEQPTLILDEAQSLQRRGSETSEVLRELLNAGIDRDSVVIRCKGDLHEPTKFKVYSPKVVALIGELDNVLADRCLRIQMMRKTTTDAVQPYRSRVASPVAQKLVEAITEWSEANADAIQSKYDGIDYFDIENDRIAELLVPLQTIVALVAPGRMEMLRSYAGHLDEYTADNTSDSVALLRAMRDIHSHLNRADKLFLTTDDLLTQLTMRDEEPWGRLDHGRPITAHKLAQMLRPYGIRPALNQDLKPKARGYYVSDLEPVWDKYLGPPTLSGNRVNCVSRVKK